MSSIAASDKTSCFQQVLASVATLPLEDQAILADVVTKRVAPKRRRQLVNEIERARHDYHHGKVRRGTAADFMTELRR